MSIPNSTLPLYLSLFLCYKALPSISFSISQVSMYSLLPRSLLDNHTFSLHELKATYNFICRSSFAAPSKLQFLRHRSNCSWPISAWLLDQERYRQSGRGREPEREMEREVVRGGASVLDLSHRYSLTHVHLLWLPLLKCIIILLAGAPSAPIS